MFDMSTLRPVRVVTGGPPRVRNSSRCGAYLVSFGGGVLCDDVAGGVVMTLLGHITVGVSVNELTGAVFTSAKLSATGTNKMGSRLVIAGRGVGSQRGFRKM